MNEQQIRQLVQQEIRNYTSGARFGLTTIPRHIHNNTDSPYAFQPILTYAGIINDDGTPILIPAGWTVVHNGTGSYSIFHHLNPSIYADPSPTFASVSVTPITRSSTAIPNAKCDASGIGVGMRDLAGAGLDNGFYFIFVVANNSSPKVPLYTGLNNTP